MAAELQPPEPPQITTAPQPSPPPPLLPEEPHQEAPLQQLPPPKRQRRPSVRLGDQPYDLHVRRTKPPIRNNREWSKSGKARSVTNLVNGNENGDVMEFGRRKLGSAKRMRSSWRGKVVEGGDSGGEGLRNDDWEWESGMKEKSPVNSEENERWEGNRRRWGNDEEENWDTKNEGVRTWLIDLGLSRYAPVFEVHEVDDQVLPFLTLEDLKDMGINAVGSRRKLYSAIQKLRRSIS